MDIGFVEGFHNTVSKAASNEWLDVRIMGPNFALFDEGFPEDTPQQPGSSTSRGPYCQPYLDNRKRGQVNSSPLFACAVSLPWWAVLVAKPPVPTGSPATPVALIG